MLGVDKGVEMIKKRRFIALLAGMALVAAGCGGSSDSSSGDAASEASEAVEASAAEASEAASEETEAEASADVEEGIDISAAEAVVAQYRDPAQPIGLSIPLTGVPDKQTIAWLECELESCPYITIGMQAATDALGWDLMVISSESANPGPYVQQAIDAGVDYIATSGLARALYEEQALAAQEAGIKMLSCFDTELPGGDATNIYNQCGDTTFVTKTGPLMADWAIVDSGGTANILIASIPDFAVLKAETDAFIAELETNCPTCEYTELDITIPQLVGGETPAAIASQLQANPDINYVFNSFGSLPFGLTASLESAGLLDQVTVYGQDFSGFDLEEIVSGTMGAWSADPKGYAGWIMVDAAARLSLGMELEEERAAASLPTYLVEDAATAQEILDAGGDWFPPTMVEDFKALWGV